MGEVMVKVFKKHIDTIFSETLREHIKGIMRELDDYNVVGPSSSSGNHHPPEDNKIGGNYNHTINVMYAAEKLAESIPQFDDPVELDVIIVSAMLHDLYKYSPGKYEHTNWDYPQLMAKFIRDYVSYYDSEISDQDKEVLKRVADCVHCHMSRWNTSRRHPDVTLPTPTKIEHLILSFADIMAADKNIRMDNPLAKL